MASSPTKKIRVEVNSAIRDGFRLRGWSAVRGTPGSYAAPESVVSSPLVLMIMVDIDAGTYGGASLTAHVLLQCSEVTDIVVGFDRSSMPSWFTRFPGDGPTRQLLNLDGQTAGGLLDPRGNYFAWAVKEHDEVESTVAAFLEMVDGQVASWAAARNTPAKVLAELGDPGALGSRFRTSGAAVRTVVGLALVQGRPDLARRAVADYEPERVDENERLALFERELAAYSPDYGPLQRG